MIIMIMNVTLKAGLSKYKLGKLTHFSNQNLESSLTFLIPIWQVNHLTFHNHVVRKELFLIMHVLGVCLYIPILNTSVY